MNKVAKQSKDLYKEKIEQLKKIYPELFSDEGNLNEDELRNFLKQFASTSEGKYEFNWAGKMSAKRNAFTTSRAMLKPDKERSIDFDKTENLIIEGENLEVLKLLQKSYQGKIKCIYIDPPYNTGNDFIYTDNFSEDKKTYWERSGTTQDGVKLDTNTESQGRYHSNWLNMIYPRLLIARNLLAKEGVIFISIDDNEYSNLQKQINEIFGEENYLLTIAINKSSEIATDYTIRKHEYILVYTKDISFFKLGGLNKKTISRATVGNLDQTMPVINFPAGLECKSIADGVYETTRKIKDSHENIENLDSIIVKDGKLANNVRLKARWRSSNDMRKFFLNNCQPTEAKISGQIIQVYFEGDRFMPYIVKTTPKKIPSLILNNKRGSSDFANLDMTNYFDYPKSVSTIKELLSMNTEMNSLILDFFAGSGTTAQAVMELNKEDSGNRRFILVQIPEKTDESSEAYKAGYKKISDICIERVKRVSKKLKEEKAKGDLGFKVFTLSPSYFPENLFTPDPEKTEEENKKALAKYIEEASTQLEFKFDEFDLMYEVLLKDGFTLNFKAKKLTELGKNNIYKVTDGEKHAYLTLDSDIKDETLQKLQKYTGERFICLERAVDTTKKWNLQNMFGSNLWVI